VVNPHCVAQFVLVHVPSATDCDWPDMWLAPHAVRLGASVAAVTHVEYMSQSVPLAHAVFCAPQLELVHVSHAATTLFGSIWIGVIGGGLA
jgi:hypothetical protein